MKKHHILIAACALVLCTPAPTHAQAPAAPAAVAPDPALTALTAKYEADIVAINKGRDDALITARAPYLATLATAEQKATAAGKLDVLKAIIEEKEAINTGATLAPVPNATLPKDLGAARGNYLRETARLTTSTAPRLVALQSAYLRDLGTLEQRATAAKNTALITQIGQEKMKLIGRATTTAGAKGAVVAGPKGKNVVVNGDFSQVDAEGKPMGWESQKKPASIQTENGNKFARCTTDEAQRYALFVRHERIQIPPNSKTIMLSARLRTDNFKIPEKPGPIVGASVHVRAFDESGKKLLDPTIYVNTRVEKTWKTHKATRDLPQGATQIDIDVLIGSSTGTMDVDDIEVEFK